MGAPHGSWVSYKPWGDLLGGWSNPPGGMGGYPVDIYRLHIEPVWARRSVGRVKPSEVQTWANGLEYSPSYARSCHMVLAQHFDVAVQDGMVKKNPARGVRLPSKPVQPVKV